MEFAWLVGICDVRRSGTRPAATVRRSMRRPPRGVLAPGSPAGRACRMICAVAVIPTRCAGHRLDGSGCRALLLRGFGFDLRSGPPPPPRVNTARPENGGGDGGGSAGLALMIGGPSTEDASGVAMHACGGRPHSSHTRKPQAQSREGLGQRSHAALYGAEWAADGKNPHFAVLRLSALIECLRAVTSNTSVYFD